MALANVAADLLGRGHKVLLVDFDLEAPGLDTFPMTLDRRVTGGLVEMITEYLDSSVESTPSLQEYVYGARIGGVNSGSLWLMPAGRQDASYDSRFRNINWQDFYENQGGFLFFEDMKAQWAEALDPDYVLIDSRTGHTDIGGICTRQLPDAVVAMFYPNEQNLRGLAPVIEDVRREKQGPLSKSIDIHFVMGNVPDLDDEDDILHDACSSAQRALHYEELAATIHHFSSLSMVSQRLLIVDRPRSKVAAEYRQLSNAIVRGNLDDRDGAISILGQALADIRAGGMSLNDPGLEERLRGIRNRHSHDIEVLGGLAKFRKAQRRDKEALELFDEILELDGSEPESLVGRAEIQTISGKPEAASSDLAAFFKLESVSPFAFGLATRLLLAGDPGRFGEMLLSPAISTLPAVVVSDLLEDLQRSYTTCEFGVSLARKWLASNPSSELRDVISLDFCLSLIGAGHFKEAQQEIDLTRQSGALGLANRFNYAMAEWGLSGNAPTETLKEVIRMIEEVEGDTEVNHLQCFSLAYWGIGDIARAIHFRDEASARFASAPRTTFSSWSYLYRSPKEFRADLDAMSAAFAKADARPAFVRVAKQPS